MKERIAIIGAGAAGCFAAANIAHMPGREVVIFEKAGKALQKVRISGGGRCNTTHHLFDIPSFAERYPRGKNFLKKTLHEFGASETIKWFEERGVTLKAEPDGRMFPDTDNSQTIIDCLWKEMMQQKVLVKFHKSVVSVERREGLFFIYFDDGSSYEADKMLIACGGYPKENQYSWLKDLGHSVESPVPSLFTFNLPGHPITSLMGVSVPETTIKITGTKIIERGPLLITHWGLSGPAILRASAWGARVLKDLNYQFSISISWLGVVTEQELKDRLITLRKENGKHFVSQKNPFELPRRLWEFLLLQCGIDDNIRWSELPSLLQNKLIEYLIRHTFQVSGKTTYKDEFVTCGGISLSEISSRTMESKLISGLFFAGEIMNVDGITGGFNFQHAWSSSFIAARSISI